MAESVKHVSGRCLCGGVRFSAKVPKREFGVCHCTMCRRWSAGPFLAIEVEGFKADDEARLGVYRSSEWAERGFCRNCGTALFYRLVGKDWCAVSVEALDDTADLVLSQQIFIDEKPGYYTFANETENLTGAQVFAAFGASETDAAQAGPEERRNG